MIAMPKPRSTLSVDKRLATASEVYRSVRDGWSGPLSVGIDLGTATCVIAVVDEDGVPVWMDSRGTAAIRDGVVVDYWGARDATASLKAAAEAALGVALTRGPIRRFSPLVVAFANAGQGAPAVGLIVLLAIWLGYGFWTAIIALTLYGLLPVLRNTITGLDGVDPTLVEAGRGLGMSPTSVLLRIELPLALPVIMAGVRTALVLVVGTATLATFIAAGGLGDIIQAGISLNLPRLMISGALLVAVLALLIEWLGRVLELATRPKGI